MAGAKPGVHVLQLKSVSVPKALQEGDKFVKWEEVSIKVRRKVYFENYQNITASSLLHRHLSSQRLARFVLPSSE